MTTSSRGLQIGVIGAGARGETFVRQLHAGLPRAQLFGVCDINRDRLDVFCEYCELDDAVRSEDPSEFLRHPRLDAVVITVPEFAHADVATAAMEAGKHIYLEKPIAHTIEDAHRILDTHRRTGVAAFLGFNLRASPARQRLRNIVRSGALGQIVHIDGLEQLHQPHGASFTRRFHRWRANNGGVLNAKCSHDIDILLWIIGHEHKVVRVASFGGTNIFTPDKQPAERCGECPTSIRDSCAYRDTPGFVFPVHGKRALYHEDSSIYGGDLCAYSPHKDTVDNQMVILEWDNGVRGSFNLQMFQYGGARETRVWGERGFAELDGLHSNTVRVVRSDTGDTTEHAFAPRAGGHGGADPFMLNRFIDTIERLDLSYESGLEEGLAATIVCVKADEAMLSGEVVEIDPQMYCHRSGAPSRAARV